VKFRRAVVILVGAVAAIIVAGFISLRLVPVQRLIEDKLYDSVPSFSSCERLPSASMVRKELEKHAELVAAIRQVAPDEVVIEPDTQRCGDDRAEILISYGSHDQRIRIQALLAKEGFGDVPVSLRNT
jgi:hypothetical protein